MDRVVVSDKVADRAGLAQALGAALLAGAELEVRVCSRIHSATDLALEAAQQGASRIVAAGGDDTLHEVLRAIMSAPAAARPAMGILPCGATHAFADQFDASLQSLAEWLRFALHGETRLVDVGMAGGIPFLHVARVEQTSLTVRGPGLEFQGELTALSIRNTQQDGLFEVQIEVGPEVQRHRIPWLELLSLKAFPISLDGAVSEHESLRFEVAREALRLAAPPPKVRPSQDLLAP
jgi:diacylglycerol kinase family enzyme